MKKITVFLMMITAAFNLYSQVTIGASVDMAIIPFQLIMAEDTDPDYFGGPEKEALIMGAGAGRNLSGQGSRMRLDVRASHEDVIGMRARIQARTDGVAIEDYLQAWWKPLPWLRIDAGRFLDDRLRGKFNDLDERMNAYTVRMYDADAIFTRFKTHWEGQAGIMISGSPFSLENLWLGALLYDLNPVTVSSAPGTVYGSHPDLVKNNADIFWNIQAAAAYTFPDIGLFRLQYFGAKPKVSINIITDEVLTVPGGGLPQLASYSIPVFDITGPRIEAAFALTAVPNLTIDVGGKFPLPFKDWDVGSSNIFEKEDETLLDPIYLAFKSGIVWQAPYRASIGLEYNNNALQIAGRVDAKFLGYMKGHSTEVHFAPEVNVHVWPSWDFSVFRLILNVGYEWIGAAYDQNKVLIGEGTPVAMNGGHRLGAGISLQKNILPNCYVKGGIAYRFAGTVNGLQEYGVLTIPLYMEYFF